MVETDHSLPYATLIHMITFKLSSANYLLWWHQVETLLQFEDLFGYLDSSIPTPPHDSSDASSAQDVNDWIAQDRCLHTLHLTTSPLFLKKLCLKPWLQNCCGCLYCP
ncbi:unnamed protein product [Cuscuta epithymum]|uniref:Retrotransposon Copia-like N-terminal domain-containing protein n=1 Tax=Cuscuta epithymum TaxID=186058 RepID=A0AAV0C4F1_9ASTE|nr:unnamed protein product [Cuscuta epithymum]